MTTSTDVVLQAHITFRHRGVITLSVPHEGVHTLTIVNTDRRPIQLRVRSGLLLRLGRMMAGMFLPSGDTDHPERSADQSLDLGDDQHLGMALLDDGQVAFRAQNGDGKRVAIVMSRREAYGLGLRFMEEYGRSEWPE